MDINNLNLNSIENDLFEKEKRCEKKINIYLKKKTKKKYTTSISNLPLTITEEKNGYKKYLKYLKKKLNCNGTIKNDKEYGIVVFLQGNYSDVIVNLLKKDFNLDDNDIILHG